VNASDPITELLCQWEKSGHLDNSDLTLAVYSQLRRIAVSVFRGEKPGHILQPTALIHETFLRLLNSPPGGWTSRSHFFGVAARSMRQVLVEHARAQKTSKRGGLQPHVPLDDSPSIGQETNRRLLALNEALEQLESVDPRQCRIVELRFFGGLSIAETARALAVSPGTVKAEWTHAKTWLKREMARSNDTRLESR
jgi:RNA polymerase sigma-70 factor, ECF subfamily